MGISRAALQGLIDSGKIRAAQLNWTVAVAENGLEQIITREQLQVEFMAHTAQQLGKAEDSTQWLARAADLTNKLLTHFWRTDHFIAVQVNGHIVIESQSLLLYMPLLLGKRLPQHVREEMIARLKVPGDFSPPTVLPP